MRAGIGEIEIDFAANEIVDNHVFAWGTKAQRPLIFENVAGVLKLFQVALVDFGPLTLKIWPVISANMRTFVPINSEPVQAVVNRSCSLLSVALAVGILDSQNQFAAVVADEQPIKKRSAGTANM